MLYLNNIHGFHIARVSCILLACANYVEFWFEENKAKLFCFPLFLFGIFFGKICSSFKKHRHDNIFILRKLAKQ